LALEASLNIFIDLANSKHGATNPFISYYPQSFSAICQANVMLADLESLIPYACLQAKFKF